MSVWTWSLLQFAVVLTAVKILPKIREDVEAVHLQESNPNLEHASPNTDITSNNATTTAPNRKNLHADQSKTEEKFQKETQSKTLVQFKEVGRESEIIVIEKVNSKGNEQLAEKDSSVENSAIGKTDASEAKDQNPLKTVKITDDVKTIELKEINKKRSSLNGMNEIADLRKFQTDADTEPCNLGYFNCFIFYNETWAIIMSILFQDGPFLVVRLILLIKYQIITQSNLFFTIKNIFVICLLLNRIRVIYARERQPWLEDMRQVKNVLLSHLNEKDPNKRKMKLFKAAQNGNENRSTWRSMRR